MTDKATMSIKEFAEYLNVSMPVAYQITEREDFTALLRVGRKKLVLREALDRYLAEQVKNGNNLGV